jgi:hypothetical protein
MNTTIGMMDFLIKLVTIIEFRFTNLSQCRPKQLIKIIKILIQAINLLTVCFY